MAYDGFVYLVGAGPGHPELITLRGLRALQQADVVAYDRLVHPDLLREAAPYAELINVGKIPGQPCISQAEINRLLVDRAQKGYTVVRLKGGDPFVFGRGGEECLALRAAGIPYEVVPGVSSAVAAPAYAGIPVTHRHLARSFTVVTGHTTGAETADLDWDALARLDTLIFLMGVSNLPLISRELIRHGRSPDTPAALVRCGTTEVQRVAVGTLTTISHRAQGIQPPAAIIIGEVVGLQPQLDWFTPPETAVFPPPAMRRNAPPSAQRTQRSSIAFSQ
jgi:uroporphyrin-III C-methyltransferase